MCFNWKYSWCYGCCYDVCSNFKSFAYISKSKQRRGKRRAEHLIFGRRQNVCRTKSSDWSAIYKKLLNEMEEHAVRSRILCFKFTCVLTCMLIFRARQIDNVRVYIAYAHTNTRTQCPVRKQNFQAIKLNSWPFPALIIAHYFNQAKD